MFQTAEYAAAILRMAADFREAGGDVGQAVAARMDRQRFLDHDDRSFSSVLEEAALRTVIGGRDVMLGQLDRMFDVMELPTVSIGIIPQVTVRKFWPGEGFWIFDDHTVTVELTSVELTIARPEEIALYVRAFEWRRESAVYGDDARRLVERAKDAVAVT